LRNLTFCVSAVVKQYPEAHKMSTSNSLLITWNCKSKNYIPYRFQIVHLSFLQNLRLGIIGQVEFLCPELSYLLFTQMCFCGCLRKKTVAACNKDGTNEWRSTYTTGPSTRCLLITCLHAVLYQTMSVQQV